MLFEKSVESQWSFSVSKFLQFDRHGVFVTEENENCNVCQYIKYTQV